MESFSNQIQHEYYGGNTSVSIESIGLENFSALQKLIPVSKTGNATRHAVLQ